MVAREIAAHPESNLDVVGFLDDNESLWMTSVENHPVFGACDELRRIAHEHGVDEAIISVPSGSRDFVRRIVALCRDTGISFKIVPGLIEIIEGPVSLHQIREVHPEDLLGRETVDFDEAAIGKELEGKRILVTGAGGSIGGEICRQLGRFHLEELLLFGRGENQIFDIEHELRAAFPSLQIRSIIGDIRDERGISQTFDTFTPDFVYHAAAHKHVHYMEEYPLEAIKNNVFGTANIIRAARRNGVERLVMLSTDKAVKPEGIMGATKRIAEYLMVDGAKSGDLPRLISVRFGNVLGSRGSVVPLFMDQINAGGPVTVSHPEASRFFMTLREACMLVVQASVMGQGGEVFILRMGSPIRIVEIAKDLIALHGLRAERDIEIAFTGLRPGEKLHEDLIVDGEKVTSSPHAYILTSRPSLPPEWNAKAVLAQLVQLTEEGDGRGVSEFLGRIIPDAQLRN